PPPAAASGTPRPAKPAPGISGRCWPGAGCPDAGSRPRRSWNNRRCAWPGITQPQVSFAVRDWPTRLGLVSAGLGIALVPGLAATAVPPCFRRNPDRDQGDGLRRQVCAVTTHDASPAARAMVRALEDEATHN